MSDFESKYVLRREYDALAIQLDQAQRHKQGRGQYLDEAHATIATLSARVAALEAALEEANWLVPMDCALHRRINSLLEGSNRAPK